MKEHEEDDEEKQKSDGEEKAGTEHAKLIFNKNQRCF